MDIGAQLRVIVAEPASELAPEPAATTEEETGAATEESGVSGSPRMPAVEGDPEEAGGTLRR